jgi:hypothetical protein
MSTIQASPISAPDGFFLARTTQQTIHGNPGERRCLPAGLLIYIAPASNLPESSSVKFWAQPVPGFEHAWPQETLDWAENVGVGLEYNDVALLPGQSRWLFTAYRSRTPNESASAPHLVEQFKAPMRFDCEVIAAFADYSSRGLYCQITKVS